MTCTPPGLDELPTQVLELVVARLDFLDVCSLRLTSRNISVKSGQGSFTAYFSSKTVKWTSSDQMHDFAQFTKPDSMGRWLQDLTLVGILSAADLEQLPFDKRLGEAFANLYQNSPHRGLQSLQLRIQGQTEDGNIVECNDIRDWHRIWNLASRTFEIASIALAESALPVQQLDIFGSGPRCSLACDRIAQVLDRADLSGPPLENLKRLSLNLSHHISQHLEDDSPTSSVAVSQKYVDDIVRLLQLCPQLEALDLRWYNLADYKLSQAQTEEQAFFAHVLQLDQLSQLRECRLRGIYTDELTLCAFLERTTQLHRLIMEEIHLTSGTFAPVFNLIANDLPHLEYLHLDNFFESSLVHFKARGEPHFPTLKQRNGPNALTLTGVKLKRKIGYSLQLGRALGSAKHSNWAIARCRTYGPPDRSFAKAAVSFRM